MFKTVNIVVWKTWYSYYMFFFSLNVDWDAHTPCNYKHKKFQEEVLKIGIKHFTVQLSMFPFDIDKTWKERYWEIYSFIRSLHQTRVWSRTCFFLSCSPLPSQVCLVCLRPCASDSWGIAKSNRKRRKVSSEGANHKLRSQSVSGQTMADPIECRKCKKPFKRDATAQKVRTSCKDGVQMDTPSDTNRPFSPILSDPEDDFSDTDGPSNSENNETCKHNCIEKIAALEKEQEKSRIKSAERDRQIENLLHRISQLKNIINGLLSTEGTISPQKDPAKQTMQIHPTQSNKQTNLPAQPKYRSIAQVAKSPVRSKNTHAVILNPEAPACKLTAAKLNQSKRKIETLLSPAEIDFIDFIETSPGIYKLIKTFNSIKLDMCIYRAKDHTHVIQCEKCQKFGHRADGPVPCKAMAPTCGICGETRQTKDCNGYNPEWSQQAISIDKKCANCGSTNHGAI